METVGSTEGTWKGAGAGGGCKHWICLERDWVRRVQNNVFCRQFCNLRSDRDPSLKQRERVREKKKKKLLLKQCPAKL